MNLERAFSILELKPDVGLEEVRQAYRELAFIWHPDKNSANTRVQSRAAKKMEELNEAYNFLRGYFASPKTETAPDTSESWGFAVCPSCGSRNRVPKGLVHTESAKCGRCNGTLYSSRKAPNARPSRPYVAIKFAVFCLLGVIALAYLTAYLEPEEKKYQEAPFSEPPASGPQQASRYARPDAAPNGMPWPASSDYVKGYPRKFTDGLSMVTVDNSGNDSDVMVKLYALSTEGPTCARVFFVKHGDRFTVTHIRRGTYDIRYRNLESGTLSKSEAFDLQETVTGDGSVRTSQVEMTLYGTPAGNMAAYPIAENDFE